MQFMRRGAARWLLAAIVPVVMAGFALVWSAGTPTRAATAPTAVASGKAAAATAISTAKAAVSTAKAGATATAGPGAGVLPVAIHNGTCAQPVAQPAYQLGNLAPYAGTAATATTGATAGPRVMTVQKTIDVKVSDLVSASQHHALVLHESAAAYSHYLACGDLAGLPTTDDHAVVALQPLAGSGWYGIATLAGSKSVPVVGTNQTQVTVYLFRAVAAGTPTP